MRRVVFTLLFAAAFMISPLRAQEGPQSAGSKPLPRIAEKSAGLERLPGYFPLYWDAQAGKLWLEIAQWDTVFLYHESLAAGVGSNDIGLDRGQPGEDYVVKVERTGPKALLVASNYGYRASAQASERQAVEEAFARSVLWGFEAAAEEDGRMLVDATTFFLRDAHRVADRLHRANQGTFRLDASRSAIYLPRTKNFPNNTEVEAILTFTSDDPGPWVQQVTPDAHAVTVRQHQSFVELPPPGFSPRADDPRSSFFGVRFMDFSAPVGQPITRQYIARFRLKKKNPSAAMSEPLQPIIYYVDRGAPEPIRSALVEGASWWNQAFTAAGYQNAFRVELLPEDADPMDVRYNVIEWAPRATRGWSYGQPLVDPRSGEIIQGHVTLDALRIRQVFLIAQGLVQPYGKNKLAQEKVMQVALARIRQLAAHETGHTLGLQHNYAASTTGRSSVMDYPPPLVTVGKDGAPDLSDAYATGIGDWDKVSITWAYQDFPAGADESAALHNILDRAFQGGLVFLTDQDARPPGSASPRAHLWDVGANALAGLQQVMAVRFAALERFSEDAIPQGAPMATLDDVLVPIYLYHRYQVSAVAKMIGGLDYFFKLRGDGLKNPEIVPPQTQRKAMAAVLATLAPDALALPEPLLRMLAPRPVGYPSTRDNFQRRTAPAFDTLAPAEAAARLIVPLLLEPHRAERMLEYHAQDAKYPSFAELLDSLLATTWKAKPQPGYRGAIQRTVNSVVLDQLIELAADDQTASDVRAMASLKLTELQNWAATELKTASDESRRAQLAYAVAEIRLFQTNPKEVKLTQPSKPPDGDPIGGAWSDDFD